MHISRWRFSVILMILLVIATIGRLVAILKQSYTARILTRLFFFVFWGLRRSTAVDSRDLTEKKVSKSAPSTRI